MKHSYRKRKESSAPPSSIPAMAAAHSRSERPAAPLRYEPSGAAVQLHERTVCDPLDPETEFQVFAALSQTGIAELRVRIQRGQASREVLLIGWENGK